MNTKPLKAGSEGSTSLSTAATGRGEGAIRTKQSSSSFTPNVFKAGKVTSGFELGIDALDKFEIFAEFRGIGFADGGIDTRVVDSVDFDTFGRFLLVGGEEVEAVLEDIIDAFELRTDINGPAQRANGDFKFGFQLVEDVERIATLPVEFVDKYNHRRTPHAAHLH